MDSHATLLTLGLLPESRNRLGRFIVSYGVQSVVCVLLIIYGVMNPDVLAPRDRDYHFVSLVDTPPPVPQAPAPVRHFTVPVPRPQVVEPVEPRPEAMRVPQEIVKKKPPVVEEQAPQVTLAAKKDILPDHLVWVVVGDMSKVESGVRELNLGEVHNIDADGNPVQ